MSTNLLELETRAQKIVSLLKQATRGMRKPMTSLIVDVYGKDSFVILIACLLSLRARDTVTFGICKQLFARAKTPHELLLVPLEELEAILRPLGFYRKKAHVIHDVSQEIIDRFNGKVPATEQELLSIKGVGRKTANLVLGEAFGIPALCVDTHVHQVANRLGLVDTSTPEQTEEQLKRFIPREQWIELSYLLVTWGQNVCVPLSPLCSRCILLPFCPQRGIVRHR